MWREVRAARRHNAGGTWFKDNKKGRHGDLAGQAVTRSEGFPIGFNRDLLINTRRDVGIGVRPSLGRLQGIEFGYDH